VTSRGAIARLRESLVTKVTNALGRHPGLLDGRALRRSHLRIPVGTTEGQRARLAEALLDDGDVRE
jgi:hypothetical protein